MKAVRLGRAAGTRNMIRVAEDAENASIPITGRSGAGKTVAMQKISQNIASDGGTVVMLSFHGIQSMIREDGIAVIDIRKEGLPFPILAPVCRPDGSRRIAAVYHLFDVVHFNSSGMERILNYFVVVFKNLLQDVHEIIMQ